MSSPSSNKLRSQIWQHFSDMDADKKVQCIHCSQRLSVANKSTCSLIRHLTKKHPTETINKLPYKPSTIEKTSREPSEEEDEGDDEDNDVWNFIEDSNGTAICAICREPLPRRAADLKRHLKLYHPKLAVSNTNGSNSDNEVVEEDRDMFTEIIYLEDQEQITPNKPSSRRAKKTKLKPKPYDRLPTILPATSTDNTIDQFMTYIASLINRLPEHVNNKLQLDIINLILKAKMEHDKPPSVIPVTSESYVSTNEVLKNNQENSPHLLISIAADQAGIGNVKNKQDKNRNVDK